MQERSESELTREVRAEAKRLGASLVGFAPYSRWAKAPLDRSPAGVFPEGKSVIVCAVHFLDATTERGGEPDPRVPDSGMAEMCASAVLPYIGYRVARFLEKRGARTLVVPQSGLWRYRGEGDGSPAENGDRGWVGDVCSYYAAVCAGLGEIGWNNLCITPEFGTRQRFVTIMTEAELTPTPLYSGPSLCDRCLLCAKHCPTQCFQVDKSGEMRFIEVDGRRFEFPDRNLWRCGIGENFQLDVFLKEWEGKHIDEGFIRSMEELAVHEHPEWVYGWKMGNCLKYCVPPTRRTFDRAFSQSPRRRRDVEPDASPERIQALLADLENARDEGFVDFLAAAPVEDLESAGLDPKAKLPTAEGAVVFGIGYPAGCRLNSDLHYARMLLRLGEMIQERYGFDALVRMEFPEAKCAAACGLAEERDGKVVAPGFDERVVWGVILTSAPLPRWQGRSADTAPVVVAGGPEGLAAQVRAWAQDAGADLVGVSPAERLEAARASMAESLGEDAETFVVEEKGFEIRGRGVWGGQAWPFNPAARSVKLSPKSPSDYLEGARSVIVFGVRLLDGSVERAGQPPADKAGHFHESVHWQSLSQLQTVLYRVAKELTSRGYRAVPVVDLEGLASAVAGGGPDLTAGRFAAVAAGLGEIGWNGMVLTPEFGPRQRFACLVTDADLQADEVYSGPTLCRGCKACVSACPIAAMAGEQARSVTLGGRTFTWGSVERLRCDCARRYGLVADEGPKFIGCTNDVAVPEKVTPEWLLEAVRDADRVQRPSGYLTIVERCFTACPAAKRA